MTSYAAVKLFPTRAPWDDRHFMNFKNNRLPGESRDPEAPTKQRLDDALNSASGPRFSTGWRMFE